MASARRWILCGIYFVLPFLPLSRFASSHSLTHSAALRVLFFCFSRHNLLHLEVYRMQDVETQCNIKSETKLRNEKDFPSILLLWHRGSFQLELSLGTALSPVLTAAAAAQQSKMGKTR